MKTRDFILATMVTLTFSFTGKAQDNGNMPNLAINTTSYNTAIGLRGGETSGLTIKHFTGNNRAIEGIVGIWGHGFSATVLLEKYAPAFNTSGLNWYYGAGGHVAFQNGHGVHYYDNGRHKHYRDGAVGLGVDGIVGLEYKIPKAPFALSLDVKPYLEVVTKGDVWMSLDPGLGIKVTF